MILGEVKQSSRHHTPNQPTNLTISMGCATVPQESLRLASMDTRARHAFGRTSGLFPPPQDANGKPTIGK